MPKEKFKPGQLYTKRSGNKLTTFKVGADGKAKPIRVSQAVKPTKPK